MLENQIPTSLTPHRDLTLSARESLKNNWGIAAVITLVYFVITCAVSIIPFATLLVAGPLSVGLATVGLKFSRNQHAEVNDLFTKSDRWVNAIGAYLLILIIVIIGCLLFIIPGIIAALGFSQTYFLLAEDKSLDPIQAITKSWNLMNGYKWDYFVFTLRFIPWAILSIFTLGIGIFFLLPYMYVSYANYHRELVGEDTAEFDPTDHLIEY